MTRSTSDLEHFDDLMEHMGVEVQDIGVGGFLPARQVQTRDHVVTFFFGDSGEFFHIGAVKRPPKDETPEQFVARVQAVLEDVKALQHHPGVGVSGVTTEAMYDSALELQEAMRCIASFPPVDLRP